MKRFRKVAVACMSMAMLAGCGGEESANTDEIVIGVNYELTGNVAQYGIAHRDGIQMAVDEINADGGINGKKIKLVIKDNKSEAAEVSAMSELLATEGAVAILGPATTGATAQAFAVASNTKVPTISASATGDSVTLDKDGNTLPYGFITCFTDSYQGGAIAEFAIEKGYNRVLVFHDTNDYGKGLLNAFEKSYKGEIVSTEGFNTDDKDFSSIITKNADQDYDAVVILGYYEASGQLVKQLRKGGNDKPILGPDGFDDSRFIDLVGADDLNNVYFTTHFTTVGDDEVVQKFIADFAEKYDGATPGAFHALGYDEAYFVADAIKRVMDDGKDVTPENVKEALENTESFSMVTGTFSMGKDHQAKKSIKVVELQNGKQVNATTVEAE